MWFDEILSKQEIEKKARRQISNKYLSLVDAEIKQKKYNSAQEYLKSARYIDPSNNSAQEMAKLIKDKMDEPEKNSSNKQNKSAPQPSPSPAPPGQKIPWQAKKTTGYVIPGDIYINDKGQQCRNIEQIAEKDGKTIQGRTTACKTANGWAEVR
ncbi:MAG: hypothetical protein IPN92_10500 [Chromatiaceae bacterium]|nr:hypothetical protein [Chromatiaceae bacterium]